MNVLEDNKRNEAQILRSIYEGKMLNVVDKNRKCCISQFPNEIFSTTTPQNAESFGKTFNLSNCMGVINLLQRILLERPRLVSEHFYSATSITFSNINEAEDSGHLK